MMQRNVVNRRTLVQEFAYLYERLRWTVYGWWLVMGTSGGVLAGFMFSPLFDSPWWLLPVYVAAVYAFKRATMRLAEWLFAPDFWWQLTSFFSTTFVLTCLAVVVSRLTSTTWLGLLLIVIPSLVIGFFHNLFRIVLVRHQFTWWYLAPLLAPPATIAGWWLLQTGTLHQADPAATAIAGAVIGFLYPFLTTILLRLMWDVSAAHSKLGTIYTEKHEGLQEAILLHRQAIALQPKDPKLYAARADTYHKHCEIDRAQADIAHALELDPRCAEARVLRAVIMAEAGAVDEAIAEFDQVINYESGFYPAYLNRARAYAQKGDFAHAFADYAEAARLSEDPALTLAYRADTYYRMGSFDDAISDCNQVMANQTMTCFAYGMVLVTRGKCYLAKGEQALGFQDLWTGVNNITLPYLLQEAEEGLRTLSNETVQEYFADDDEEIEDDDEEIEEDHEELYEGTSATQDFNVVVSYEEDAARNRSSYSFKLLLLALLPYVYVLTVLATIFTLFGLLLWTIISGVGRDGATLRIEIALAVVAALLLRSIWVRVPPPEGFTTSRPELTSALLSTAHEIARALRAPKIHAIFWTEEFDLSITPAPRFSLVGWPLRYHLRLGLPLLNALSSEQFRARLGHELGHFAGTHGRFRSWLYRYHLVWPAVSSALTARARWGSWFFGRFFVWYVRFFLNYGQAAFRYHEYEADRCAADVTTAEVTAEALIRLDYHAYKETNQILDDADAAKEWLEYALQEKTSIHELHPVLKDRLAALEQTVRLPTPISQSAAEAYLGDHLTELTEALQNAEREGANPAWPQSDEEPPAVYAQGVQMLAEDRAEGVALLEEAMNLNPELTFAACWQIAHYYKRKNDLVTAHRYSRRSQNYGELYDKAVTERTQLSFIESFLPHALSAEEIAQLRHELARHKEIKEAYLVRKEVTYFPDKPLHALSLVLDRSWFNNTPADISFGERLPPATKRPPELYTVVLDYKNRRLGNIMRTIPNSLIYKNSIKNDGTK